MRKVLLAQSLALSRCAIPALRRIEWRRENACKRLC